MLKAKTAILAATFALGTAFPVLSQEISGATVVASVNGQEITMGHIIATRLSLPEQYQSLPDDVLFDGILEQLIQQTVLSQAIGQLSHRIELQLENERRALIAGEMLDGVIAGAITDEALQAVYDATYAETPPTPEYDASHILVATEAEALDLIKLLEDGGDFAALAREHSTGPSGANGGELGWFSDGMMVQPFEEAVKLLEVGQVSPPVQTQFGWHVLILNNTREQGPPPLEEVREELVAQIEDDAVTKAVSALVEAAQIERADLGTTGAESLRMVELIE